MPQTIRLQRLRNELYGPPSRETWEKICSFFEAWSWVEDLTLEIAYAESHLSSWPDKLRVAPLQWFMNSWDQDQDPPTAWPIIRSFEGHYKLLQHMKNWKNPKWWANITHLDLSLLYPSEEQVRCIFTSPALRHISHLTLAGLVLEQKDFSTQLNQASFRDQLTSLSFLGTRNSVCSSIFEEGSLIFQLQRLKFSNLHIAQEQIAIFNRSLIFEKLTHLQLQGCNLSTAGAREIADATSFPVLKKLALDKNSIHIGGTRELLKMTRHSPIEHLDLSGNNLGLDELVGLNALDGKSSLHSLDLSNNRIEDEACAQIANCSLFQDLEQLHLRNNPFKETGVRHLIKSPYLSYQIKKPYLAAWSDEQLKAYAKENRIKVAKKIHRLQMIDRLILG